MTYGKIAYEAYCNHRGWQSVRGSALPAFDLQDPDVRTAWEIAAKAVVDETDVEGLQDQLNSAQSEVAELQERLDEAQYDLEKANRRRV